MWHRFNPNPRGSSVGDCVVRAVAAATGQSWEQAYIALALTGYALGDMPSANRTWGTYLQKRGFKRRMVEADCTTCYTVADFAREYPRGVYVLGCSGHVLTVIDGAGWDSWDSGAECPIYYWYKESVCVSDADILRPANARQPHSTQAGNRLSVTHDAAADSPDSTSCALHHLGAGRRGRKSLYGRRRQQRVADGQRKQRFLHQEHRRQRDAAASPRL